jgi:hypothetical protein
MVRSAGFSKPSGCHSEPGQVHERSSHPPINPQGPKLFAWIKNSAAAPIFQHCQGLLVGGPEQEPIAARRAPARGRIAEGAEVVEHSANTTAQKTDTAAPELHMRCHRRLDCAPFLQKYSCGQVRCFYEKKSRAENHERSHGCLYAHLHRDRQLLLVVQGPEMTVPPPVDQVQRRRFAH